MLWLLENLFVAMVSLLCGVSGIYVVANYIMYSFVKKITILEATQIFMSLILLKRMFDFL